MTYLVMGLISEFADNVIKQIFGMRVIERLKGCERQTTCLRLCVVRGTIG